MRLVRIRGCDLPGPEGPVACGCNPWLTYRCGGSAGIGTSGDAPHRLPVSSCRMPCSRTP